MRTLGFQAPAHRIAPLKILYKEHPAKSAAALLAGTYTLEPAPSPKPGPCVLPPVSRLFGRPTHLWLLILLHQHSLCDALALERIRLANERTVLAYVRTGIALVIASFSLINFFRENLYLWVGVLFVLLGFGLSVLGWVRFHIKAKRISQALLAPMPAG